MIIRVLGIQDYQEIFEKMKDFTLTRTPETEDEVWLLEHPPVYTLGQAGRLHHILNPKDVPIVQSDRGGQVTYHGPGQLVAYFLFDLKRQNLGIRTFVCQLEALLIDLLKHYGIDAARKEGAPGVYTNEKKIASLGLRVKKGASYHGLALNIAMDLDPFLGINPCGFEKLSMSQICDFLPEITFEEVLKEFQSLVKNRFTVSSLDSKGCALETKSAQTSEIDEV